MREEKQLLLDEIKEKLGKAPGVVVARYANFTASKAIELRSLVTKTGGDFEVVRKRVFLKAAAEAGIHIDLSQKKGHIALLLTGTDPVETTKAFFTLSKENPDMLEVLGGHFEGQSCSPSDVEALASLPSKDVLRAQLLGVLVAPMTQTLGVIQSLLTSVLYAIENKRKKDAGE